MWAMPGIQKAIGDDFGVVAWPGLQQLGRQAVDLHRRLGALVSAKAKNVDAAKEYVKWLWIDQTQYQEDFDLSYGFHIPPRKRLAAKATKLQSRPGRRASSSSTSTRRRQPGLDAEDEHRVRRRGHHVVRKGGDPDAETRQGARRRSTPSSKQLFG